MTDTSPAIALQYLRFYGGDFRPAERQRIVAWLGRDDAGLQGTDEEGSGELARRRGHLALRG